MRLALTLVALLVPSLAPAGSATVIATRLRTDGSRGYASVGSTSATATGLLGASPRVLANSGCTSVGRPACASRGVLLGSNVPRGTSCSSNSSWRRWDACDRGGGWNRYDCAPVRNCGGAGVVVMAPTVVVVGGGGCGGSWGTATRSTGTWGWGGGVHASRPADIRVAWQAAGAR